MHILEEDTFKCQKWYFERGVSTVLSEGRRPGLLTFLRFNRREHGYIANGGVKSFSSRFMGVPGLFADITGSFIFLYGNEPSWATFYYLKDGKEYNPYYRKLNCQVTDDEYIENLRLFRKLGYHAAARYMADRLMACNLPCKTTRENDGQF